MINWIKYYKYIIGMQMGLYKSDISNSIIDHYAIRRRQHGAIRLEISHFSRYRFSSNYLTELSITGGNTCLIYTY